MCFSFDKINPTIFNANPIAVKIPANRLILLEFGYSINRKIDTLINIKLIM